MLLILLLLAVLIEMKNKLVGYHIACAIYNRRIIAFADCKKDIHAEMNVLKSVNSLERKHNIKKEKVTILVVRIISSFTEEFCKYGMSKPCLHCTNILKKSGIGKVAWSNEDGEIVMCKTCNLNTTHISSGNRF